LTFVLALEYVLLLQLDGDTGPILKSVHVVNPALSSLATTFSTKSRSSFLYVIYTCWRRP